MRVTVAIVLTLFVTCLLGIQACVGSHTGGDGNRLPLSFTAVTFNSGTSENMGHDNPPDDGYTSQHAAISDQYYGDGLAWSPAVAATREFFAQVNPEIVIRIFFHRELEDGLISLDGQEQDLVASMKCVIDGIPDGVAVDLKQGITNPQSDFRTDASRRYVDDIHRCFPLTLTTVPLFHWS